MNNTKLAKILITNILARSENPLKRSELKNKTCLKEEFLREGLWQLLEEKKIELTWDLKFALPKKQELTVVAVQQPDVHITEKVNLIPDLDYAFKLTRRQNMSNTSVPVKTMKEAVQDSINHFKSQKANFSVFDITKLIRERVNAPLFYLEGVWVNQIPVHPMTGQLERQTVNHAKVLEAFNTLWETDPDPDYEMTFGSLYRIFKYTPKVTSATTTNDSVVTVTDPVVADQMLDTFVNKMDTSKVKPVLSSEEKLKTRLEHYLQYGRPYRIKFNDEFIVLSKGRTAWRRPCNAGYSLNRWAEKNSVVREVEAMKKEGKIKFVKVNDATSV